MKLAFLVIGKTIDRHLQELQSEYQKRISFYAPFEYICLPELKNTKSLSESEQKDKEGELLCKQITPNDYVVLLDEHGKEFRSVQFAGYIEGKLQTSYKRLLFVIGGHTASPKRCMPVPMISCPFPA